MGRPISDITSSLKYEGFIADAEQVLHDLHTIEREVQVADGAWYMTRIAPYRTSEDRIAGVVATFIDISRRKKAEEELRTSREEARKQARVFDATLSTIATSLISSIGEGRFVFTNKPLLDLWGLKLEEAVGKNFFDLRYDAGAGGEAAPTGRGGLHDRQDRFMMRPPTPALPARSAATDTSFGPLARGPAAKCSRSLGSYRRHTEAEESGVALRKRRAFPHRGR